MEYYNRDTANTFDLTITPDGDYKFNYSELDIRNHQMFVGTVGDLNENQYKQYFFHNARANGGYYWTSEEGSQPIWVHLTHLYVKHNLYLIRHVRDLC